MSGVERQGTMESPRAPPPKHLRAIGRLEWFLFARTMAQADSCVIVAARYLPAHSGDIINKAALYPALGEVVRNNVALASRIAPASRKRRPPEWVRLPSLDLDRVVEFINDDFGNLESVFESQFRRAFDPDTDLPLWRLAVLRDGTLLFAFDHALCDGLSGLAFHRLLLKALQEDRTSPTSVRFAEDQRLPPALEAATRVAVPWRTVLRETLKLFNPLAWRRHLATWAGNRVPMSFELDMRVHILTYAPDEAQRLLALARAHGATLTATLHTLALLVLSRLLDRHGHGHGHGKHRFTTTYVPISLRRATGASRDAFCNHYSYHFSEHALFSGAEDSAFPWADAARFTRALKAAVPHAASAMGLLKLVGGGGGQFVRRPLGHRRVVGIELSNLGSFSLGPEEGEDAEQEQEQEQELEGRHAVEVVPTPAVAVAETVKSQDASRGAGGASAAADDSRADTAEDACTTANGGDTADIAHVAGRGRGERPVTPPPAPVTVPETPVVSAAPVTDTGTQGRERGTIASAPVAGDKEMSASPHDSAATTAPSSPPTDSDSDSDSGSVLDANSMMPARAKLADKAAFPEPTAGESAIASDMSMPSPAQTRDDNPELGLGPGSAHQPMPAKEAQDPDPADTAPPTALRTETETETETEEPHAHARARTTSETSRGPACDRCAQPELELVSPQTQRQRPTGNSADPPHPIPVPIPSNPAPTGNARKPVANSASCGASRRDNAVAGGQARPVGNGFPTHAEAQERAPPAGTGTPPPLWALREVLFAQGDGTLGAALKVCVAGTPAGGLGVVVSWGARAVDEEFGKAFVVGLADGVRALTGTVNGNGHGT